MYTVIRRYEGLTDADEVVKRAAEEFGPTLASRPGFQGYYLVKAGGGVIASISVFESQAEAEASTAAAADWARERLAELAPNPPQVTAGETTGINP
jgi:heme-degrading monooxygenase HmoA